MKKSLIACALAFSILPLAAHAEPAAQMDPSAIGTRAAVDFLDVVYGDLNLTNAAGAKVLYSRIKFAATRVCGGLPDIREVQERRNFKSCLQTATNDAVQQVDAPLVTALFFEDHDVKFSTASR